jgi:hypothetical protein
MHTIRHSQTLPIVANPSTRVSRMRRLRLDVSSGASIRKIAAIVAMVRRYGTGKSSQRRGAAAGVVCGTYNFRFLVAVGPVRKNAEMAGTSIRHISPWVLHNHFQII